MLSCLARLSPTSVAVCALLTGCAVPVESGGQVEGETASVHAFLNVEQSAALGQQGEGTRQTAAATFLRVPDGTDPQLMARMVGAVVDLPLPGQCRVEGQGEGLLPLRMLNPIEMVPVGEVSVRAGEASTRLVARAYPDVAHLISGVVYTSSGREQPVKPVVGESLVTFDVAGGEGVAGFEVAVSAPEPVDQLRVERDEGGGPVVVAWQAASESRRAGAAVSADVGVVEGDDQFFVDVVFGAQAAPVAPGDVDGELLRAPRTVRCGGAATSTIAVPAALSGERAVTSVAVHRLRTIRLTTPALGGGQVRVDVMRLLSVPEARGEEATR
ncbi:MAG: hypothetical protein EOO75_00580 [Myxococcales bacterium]|nr:MAG: hypothetical protein EOO75_00580 [Myxococcales bacterium]